MSTLLDTSVLISASAAGGEQVHGGWAVSAISVGELEAGVLLARDAAVRGARLRRLTAVLAEAPILDVNRDVASCYGQLRAVTHRSPSNDLWIAATAIAYDMTLLTADERQASLPLVQAVLAR